MVNTDDRLAIAHTLSWENHLVDAGELDRLGEVFTPDVVYELGVAGIGTVEGLDAVRDAARSMARAGAGPLAHHLTDTVITGERDGEATAVSKVLLLMHDGTARSAVQHDTVRREEDGWRVASRVIRPLGATAPEAEPEPAPAPAPAPAPEAEVAR